MISSHFTPPVTPTLKRFGEVAFTDECSASLKQGLLPAEARLPLATLIRDTRQVLKLMTRPSFKDRAWFSKEWRKAHGDVKVRATLLEEAAYLKKALDELQRLAGNPQELRRKGASQFHCCLQRIGVEPALMSEADESVAWDWASGVFQDLESIMSEANELQNLISVKGFQQEEDDQRKLYVYMKGMMDSWADMRSLIFHDPTAGPWKQVTKRVPYFPSKPILEAW